MRFKILSNNLTDESSVFVSLRQCTFNLATLDRIINHSQISYRRIAEILGVSDIEIEDLLRDLVQGKKIEMIIPQTQARLLEEQGDVG